MGPPQTSELRGKAWKGTEEIYQKDPRYTQNPQGTLTGKEPVGTRKYRSQMPVWVSTSCDPKPAVEARQ
jgi:lipoprotein-anchoring transpeptidase ErfK/SrfK